MGEEGGPHCVFCCFHHFCDEEDLGVTAFGRHYLVNTVVAIACLTAFTFDVTVFMEELDVFILGGPCPADTPSWRICRQGGIL